jgi:hypothetical protein
MRVNHRGDGILAISIALLGGLVLVGNALLVSLTSVVTDLITTVATIVGVT